jgi:hypothetical protein
MVTDPVSVQEAPTEATPGPPPAADNAPTPPKGMIIGSWKPDAELGFEKQWVDEEGLHSAFTKDKASRRIWSGFTCQEAVMPLDILVRDREGPAIAYVFVLVARHPVDGVFEDQDAVLHVRHRGRLAARLDGKLVLDLPPAAPGEWAEARVPVVLTDPYDVLLLKLGRGSDELGESLDVEVRVSAPDGSAIPGQSWNTMRPPGLPSDLDP